MMTPEQLRTLCNNVADELAALRQQMASLQRDTDVTKNNIIAAQGLLAGLQVALGDPHDPDTVPMDLTV